MDPADLLGALVRGAFSSRSHKKSGKALRYLTGRGRGSFLTAGTMLTAAGMAWGLYETWQSGQGGQTGQSSGGSSAAGPSAPVGPPPIPGAPASQGAGGGADLPHVVRRIVQLTISAARADGALGDSERNAILEQARAVGAEALVQTELARTTMLAEVVSGVTDPAEKEELYVLAFAIVRADETVSGAERIYLAQLAAHLGLDSTSTARLEQDAARQIDGQDDSRG